MCRSPWKRTIMAVLSVRFVSVSVEAGERICTSRRLSMRDFLSFLPGWMGRLGPRRHHANGQEQVYLLNYADVQLPPCIPNTECTCPPWCVLVPPLGSDAYLCGHLHHGMAS
eukprot:scpid47218/ scgid18314/ 